MIELLQVALDNAHLLSISVAEVWSDIAEQMDPVFFQFSDGDGAGQNLMIEGCAGASQHHQATLEHQLMQKSFPDKEPHFLSDPSELGWLGNELDHRLA